VFTQTRTITDPAGVTDTTSRVHVAARVASEAVGVTDTTLDNLLYEVIRPIADISAAGWDTAPTASEALWDQLDEFAASDTDYIFAEAP
jgi:hypothetical protein